MGITISIKYLNELQTRGINVSGLIDELIGTYLGIQKDSAQRKLEEIEQEMNEHQTKLVLASQQKAVIEKQIKEQKIELETKIKTGELIVVDEDDF